MTMPPNNPPEGNADDVFRSAFAVDVAGGVPQLSSLGATHAHPFSLTI
jgi:hypothetical protein